MSILRRWLGYETDVLISPLPIDECVSRLRAVVTEEGVIGEVGENTLRLRKALAEGAYNSFQTYLRATLESERMSTRLICRFGPHPFVAVFMVFWVCLALAIAVAILIINSPASDPGDMTGIFVAAAPFVMIPMGIAMAVGGRHIARGERPFLLDFLRKTIDARQRPQSDAARSTPVVER
jgi:hypothetical protein